MTAIGRIGLAERLMLILMAALLSMVVASVGLDVLASRRTTFAGPRPAPRLIHAAGMISLLRNASPALRRRVLRLGSDAAITLQLFDSAPAPAPMSTDLPAPHSEAALRDLVGAGPELRAFTDAAGQTPPEKVQRLGDGRIAKVIAPLGGGQTLVITWADPLPGPAFAVLGLPPSVLAGILGLAVAALALFITLREIRPLRRLTASISTFDGAVPGDRIIDGGAPDVRRLGVAVYDMQRRVSHLLAERSFLIGAITHDLKTYLTRLRLRAEALSEGGAAERIVADIEAMSELLDTSLAFARGTASSGRRVMVDLGDLAASEVEERNALGSRLRVEGRYNNGAVVVGDPIALRRVLSNIVDNAEKFGRSAILVEVGSTIVEAHVVISDDGPGIPAAQRDSVFDPYVRLEQSRSWQTGGSGLGLAIARQIVEMHGGKITISGAPSGGARVDIAIPVAHRLVT